MGRSGISLGAGSLAGVSTEADVRRLCGATAFHWGDIWQRENHVSDVFLELDGLHGRVRGTWRRVDRVTVSAQSGQVHSTCTCNEGDLCRHAAAVLLQWLRQPQSLAQIQMGNPASDVDTYIDVDDLDDFDFFDEPYEEEEIEPERLTATQEFARLLEPDTMQHLREIARRRVGRITARNKAELVEQLASVLGDPDNVDAALAALNDDEWLTLEAISLIRVGDIAQSQAIGKAYEVLGGHGPLQAGVPKAVLSLADLGLIFPADRWATPSRSYSIPAVVASCVAMQYRGSGPIQRMFGTLDAKHVLREMNRVKGTRGEIGSQPGLGLMELFQVIVQELRRGQIGTDIPPLSREETSGVPLGWRRDSTQRTDAPGKRNQPYDQRYVRILPLPSLLSTLDLNHLSKVSGQPVRMVNFAMMLMGALGIIDMDVDSEGYTILINENRFLELLGLPHLDRTTIVVNTWLSMGDQLELGLVANVGGPVILNYASMPHYYSGASLPQPAGAAVRRMVARVVGRLLAGAEDREAWYDPNALLELLWKISPSLLTYPQPAQPLWWFATQSNPETHLKLERRGDWDKVWRPVIEAILTGPMTWLQLAEVAAGPNGVLAFRPRNRAGVFLAQGAGDEEISQPGGAFEVDLQHETPIVFVSSGRSDTVIYSLLWSLGEMVDVSPQGLSYRLDPARLQAAFDIGMTGAQVIEHLARQGDEQLATALAPAVEKWWARYGLVRLYDDLTLIELNDDLLLREILASSTLQDALVHTFSPRLVAVKPAQVDALVAELNRLGYTPRMAGEA